MNKRNEFPTMRHALWGVAQDVMFYGKHEAPRGTNTKEILAYSFVVTDPTDALPTGINRKVSMPMAAIEAAQLVGGFSDVAHLRQINPTMQRFFTMHSVKGSDQVSWVQHGAYGPRVREPMLQIERILKADPSSRQALLNIWSSRKDYVSQPDIPCTVAIQFLIRDDTLVMSVYMRSNDVWWGLTYDGFQFTQLQLALANALGIEPGPYYHTAGSMHIYERDFDSIEGLNEPIHKDLKPNYPGALGASGWSMSKIQDRVRVIANAAKNAKEIDLELTQTEKWYYSKLKYVSPREDQG